MGDIKYIAIYSETKKQEIKDRTNLYTYITSSICESDNFRALKMDVLRRTVIFGDYVFSFFTKEDIRQGRMLGKRFYAMFGFSQYEGYKYYLNCDGFYANRFYQNWDVKYIISTLLDIEESRQGMLRQLHKNNMNSVYGLTPLVVKHDDKMDALYYANRYYMGISKEDNKMPKIKNVIFNDPATIVMWDDETKTVVKAENESFDKEKGLAMAISKKALGNHGRYFEIFKKYIKGD